MLSKPKVYVVQETTYDVSPAEAWGELVFVSVDRRDDFLNIINSEHNERMLNYLAGKIKDYDESKDYIIPIGSPYISAAVMWILGAKGIRRLNILRWDNRDQTYRPLHLDLTARFKAGAQSKIDI